MDIGRSHLFEKEVGHFKRKCQGEWRKFQGKWSRPPVTVRAREIEYLGYHMALFG